jgi:hypothetical protein
MRVVRRADLIPALPSGLDLANQSSAALDSDRLRPECAAAAIWPARNGRRSVKIGQRYLPVIDWLG